MAETLKLITNNEEQSSEDFARSLKNCLEYLKAESEEQAFHGTAYILDIALVTIQEDLAKTN